MPDLSYDGIDLERDYGRWEYPWRDRIERYLEATENAFPWHHGASPWGPPVAPPTVLGSGALRFIESFAPLPPGTLHAKFELEITNALRRDRETIGYGKFVDKYERSGRRWCVFSASFRDGSGLLFGRSTVTLAFPETVETKDEERERGKEKRRKAELTLPARTLTQEKMTAYSEDTANALRGKSIHTDPEVAKAYGFPNTVAPGLMSADYISELMTVELERGWLQRGKLSLAFVKPAFCGDTLTARAALREELDEGAFTRRVYDAWCENQEGETVTVGTASGVVRAG